MELHQQTVRDKLILDLQNLKNIQSNSLVFFFIKISNLFDHYSQEENQQRNLNFLTYELSSMSQKSTEWERFFLLNDYFFKKRNFSCSQKLSNHCSLQNLTFKQVLHQKTGHPLVLALIYQYLAGHLNLSIFLLNTSGPFLLKLLSREKTIYIDFVHNGTPITEEEFIHIYNKHHLQQSSPSKTRADDLLFTLLSPQQILCHYLKLLSQCHEISADNQKTLLIYDLLLAIDPMNLPILAQRSLLLRKMGHWHEAVVNLKRYFSFVDQDQAHPELKSMLAELQQKDHLHLFSPYKFSHR